MSRVRDSVFDDVVIMSTPSALYSLMNSGTGDTSTFVTMMMGLIDSWKALTRNLSMSPRRGSGLADATTINN